MARTIFSLVGRIKTEGLQELGKGLLSIDKKLTKTANKVARFGRNVSKIGVNVTKLTAPLGIAAVASVKFGADFEKAMTNSLAIMGNVSDEMKKKMGGAARDVAKTSTFSAKEAADSYYFLASAGLSAVQAIEAMPRVSRFAQAGNFDLALATDLLTDAQSALGLSSDDTAKSMANMSRVSDVLVKANTLANASVQQFSEALTNKAGAALRLLGKDIEEGAAVLAVYADQGNKGAGAGESLNIVLRDLQKASINNRKAFESAGVSVFDAAGEMRSMADIVTELESHLGDMSDEQKRTALSTLGFTDKSISATTALIGTSDAIRKYEKDLRRAGGTTSTVADKQLESLWAQLELIKNRLIDVGIEFSEGFIPILKNSVLPLIEALVGKLMQLANWFTDLSGGMQNFIMVTSGVLVVLGPVLVTIGQLISSVKILSTTFTALRGVVLSLNAAFLATPVGMITLAIGALGVAVYGSVKAYRALNFERKTSIGLIKEERDTLAGLSEGQKDFVKSVKALDEWNKSFRGISEGLHGAAGAQKIYEKGVDSLVKKAAKLGYTVRETNDARVGALKTISAEVQGLKDSEGYLIRYTHASKAATRSIQTKSEATVEWEQRVKEQAATELELIELKRQAAKSELDLKERTSANISAIDTYYDIERKKLIDEQVKDMDDMSERATEAAQEKRDAELAYLDSVTLAAAEATGNQLDALRLRRDAELEAAETSLSKKEEIESAKAAITEKYREEEKELLDQAELEKHAMFQAALVAEQALNDQRVQMGVGMVGRLAALGRGDTKNKITRINQELAADKARIKNSALSEKEKAAQIKEIEAAAEKDRVKLQRRQAMRDKAISIFGAIASTAQAVAKALTAGPFVGPIMAALIGAMGIAQIAIIKAQPLPRLATGALAKRRKGGTQVVVGEGSDDEAILPMRKGAAEIAKNIIRRIGEAVSPLAPVRSSGSAAQSDLGLTTQPGGTIVVNLGNLIGDDRSLKEFTRRLEPFRIAENQRRGVS